MANSRSRFDDFAEWTSRQISRAPFFVFCVALVAIWLPSFLIIRNLDTWQLVINTTTTIFTFLMVAVLENSTQRFEDSVHTKLDGVLDLLGEIQETNTAQAERTKGIEKEIGT